MKKALAILVSLFLISCLAGCFPNVFEPVEQDGEGTLGDYYVKVTDHFVTKTVTGKDVLILSFDFTNNNTTGASASSALRFTLFQSGIELSQAFLLLPLSGYSSTNYYAKVKDSATLPCQAAFYLRSVTALVEVEVAPSISLAAETVKTQLDITN